MNSKLITKYLQDSLVRNVSVLTSGIFISQLSFLLATPILTRLYSPADFGTYALIIAILSILSPIAALRLELAIPIPNDDSLATEILAISIVLSLIITLTLALLLIIDPFSVTTLLNLPTESAWMIWFIPVFFLLFGLQQCFSYWNIRIGQIVSVSQSRGSYGIIATVSQVILGVTGSGAIGLLIGELLGRLFLNLWLLLNSRFKLHNLNYTKFSFKIFNNVFHNFSRFILLSTPSSFINALSIYLPVLFIGIMADPRSVGLLLLAQRVAGLINVLLAGSISQVYNNEVARQKTSLERAALFKKTTLTFTIVTAPFYLLVFLLSPYLFGLLFGNSWKESGLLAAILAPFYFLQLLSGATISTLEILQLHWQRLGRELMFFTGTAIVLFISYYLKLNLNEIVTLYVLHGIVFYIFSILWLYKIIRRS